MKILLGFLPCLLHPGFLLLPLLGLQPHPILGDEEAVEYLIEGHLLLPGLGKHRPQGGLDPLPVLKSQMDEDLAGVGAVS